MADEHESVDEKFEKARENDFHVGVTPEEMTKQGYNGVKGYDFDEAFDFQKMIDSFATTGAQASHLAQAIAIIREMRHEKGKGDDAITIYLGYTSNMVSSGLRDVFKYLVKHKLVDVIVTTAGGIEEDIMKCISPFFIGAFEAPGAKLREQGLNRIGNIFVPNENYVRFEKFLTPFLNNIADQEVASGKSITPSEFINQLGAQIDNEDSIYYWCHKNKIPVFCPALVDGSIGDMIYFFLYKRPEFTLDTAADVKKLNDITMEAKKTGMIILGSGVVKHHICNTNMMRNGADYAVYINNAAEFDASDAGARPDEAVSWGKILPDAKTVKVFGDATIIFPLVVASAFKN